MPIGLASDFSCGSASCLPAITVAFTITRPLYMEYDRVSERWFISTQRPHGVQMVDKEGKLLGRVDRGHGWGPGQFSLGPGGRSATGMALDSDKRILYVADAGGNRIQLFDLNHEVPVFREVWRPIYAFALTGPEGVTLDPRSIDNYLYVSDTWNSRIVVFSVQGQPTRILGSPGFTRPMGTRFHSYTRTLLACDSSQTHIKELSPTGTVIRTFGRFERASDIAFSRRSIMVVDHRGDRVFQFARDATLIRTLGPGLPKMEPLSSPTSILFNEATGVAFISDTENHRIVRWVVDTDAD